MRSYGKFFLLLGLVVVCSVSVFSVPFPYDGLNTEGSLEADGPNNNDDGQQVFDRGASPVPGDTISLFCPIKVFSFGTSAGNDCWGWTAPDGTDYAIYGMRDGVAFINTVTMQVSDVVTFTAFCSWRDMKTYGHYCYAVSECGGEKQGMMVIDMQFLPDSVRYIKSINPVPGVTVTSHNLFIDTIKGYLYAEGTSSTNQAIQIFSLSNPANPTWVGSFGIGGGIHDMYIMNDTAYVAEGWNPSFSIWNVANKSNPQFISRVNVPTTGYVHNIWPTEDGKYVATTEETAFHTVKMWDIQDPFNVQLLGDYLAPGNLAHNAQIKGDKLYISHYESGVAIVDISNPSVLTEIARYDTYTSSEDPDFAGCWGVYNYASDGLIYASNMDGRLFILEEAVVVLNDTVVIDTVAGDPGSQSRVDIYAVNSLSLRQLIVPFTWAGDFNMTLDSVSTVGLRTEYFEEKIFNSTDYANDRVSVRLTADIGGGSPNLPPGSGPILSLWFTVPWGANGGPNPVNITAFNNKQMKFINNCLTYDPAITNGAVSFDLNCCDLPGDIDNSGTIDIADVTFNVDYMFNGGAAPDCFGEADLDASCSIDIVDLNYRVSYMFLGGPAPLPCATCPW